MITNILFKSKQLFINNKIGDFTEIFEELKFEDPTTKNCPLLCPPKIKKPS